MSKKLSIYYIKIKFYRVSEMENVSSRRKSKEIKCPTLSQKSFHRKEKFACVFLKSGELAPKHCI